MSMRRPIVAVLLALVLCAVVAAIVPMVASARSIRTGTPTRMVIELTGYSFQDNSPSNSNDICCGVVHKKAGGRGTFSDPITVAAPGSARSTETPIGTRFYLPSVNRYVVVEDSGASKMSRVHLDVYVDGKDLPRRFSDNCMSEITGKVAAIKNPGPGMPVTPGPLTSSRWAGCLL
jgi:3D (Asp-Asp-Asp) domain-containing protein